MSAAEFDIKGTQTTRGLCQTAYIRLEKFFGPNEESLKILAAANIVLMVLMKNENTSNEKIDEIINKSYACGYQPESYGLTSSVRYFFRGNATNCKENALNISQTKYSNVIRMVLYWIGWEKDEKMYQYYLYKLNLIPLGNSNSLADFTNSGTNISAQIGQVKTVFEIGTKQQAMELAKLVRGHGQEIARVNEVMDANTGIWASIKRGYNYVMSYRAVRWLLYAFIFVVALKFGSIYLPGVMRYFQIHENPIIKQIIKYSDTVNHSIFSSYGKKQVMETVVASLDTPAELTAKVGWSRLLVEAAKARAAKARAYSAGILAAPPPTGNLIDAKASASWMNKILGTARSINI